MMDNYDIDTSMHAITNYIEKGDTIWHFIIFIFHCFFLYFLWKVIVDSDGQNSINISKANNHLSLHTTSYNGTQKS